LYTSKSKICTCSALLLLLLILIPFIQGQPGERIRGLVIGHSMYVWSNPFRILFLRDPAFDHSLYPLPPDLCDDDKRKLDRVYYPRTRELLVNGYDLMVFHSARIQHFVPRQIHDLDHAFREEGMVAMNGLSLAWDTAWVPTILSDLLPISEHEGFHFQGYTVDLVRERDPVLTPFLDYGVEKVVGTQITTMVVRQGAVVWGYMRPQNLPWLVSWRPGGTRAGMQWVVAHIFDSWWSEEYNPYGLDVATNMIFYSLDMPLVSDIPARREARRLFTIYQGQKSLVLSMMEWADNLGVNTVPLSDRLFEIEVEMEESMDSYLEQDYPSTISFLNSLSPRVVEIAEEAVRLKDEAMLWIYVSEWLVVSSAGIISGFVLWTLMIRRRMFREVKATRFA